MGIQGLLPFLKDIHRPVHLRNYSGQTLAVDTYVWLHRGAFSCALELCTGVKTTRYVNYCMRQVQLLLDHGVKPLMVFDGGCLPMKTGTEEQRKKKREEGMKKGNQYLRSGDKTKAMEVFQGCVDVTPRMAYELIKELRKAGVEYIVAPYEADAQITYLVKLGIADAAVTEDSDLVVFECPKVVVKLDKEGNGIEICAENLGRVSGMELWTHKRFRHMCIMSGCDYLESPTGVGLKKAQVYLKHKYAEDVLKTWKWGRATNAPKCPPNYAKNFRLAELTFLHQRVYDPLIQEIVHLTPPPSDLHIDAEVSLVVGPYVFPFPFLDAFFDRLYSLDTFRRKLHAGLQRVYWTQTQNFPLNVQIQSYPPSSPSLAKASLSPCPKYPKCRPATMSPKRKMSNLPKHQSVRGPSLRYPILHLELYWHQHHSRRYPEI
ncbi:PIN domain-like protein [Phlyctochytrium arcticum]|nr:PIN domain-like protein [Phlyctochytrium arcticum]